MDCSQRITQIKKYILLLILSSLTFVGYAQKQNYMYNFTSESQLRRYLADNVATLDPAEGVYDVQFIQKNGSPFAQNSSDNWTYFIVKDPNSSTFEIYSDASGSGISKSDNVRIESIGETNAYRLYWHNSSNRAYLENNLRLSTTIQLSQTDARNFAENPKFAHWITLTYDMVKRYPTASMHTDAVRKQVEETKPTEWTGTGFALTNNYIVTNYHVVEDAKTISIQGINGNFNNKYNATVVASDKFNDLALLRVNGVTITTANIPYSVKTTTSDVGEDVFVLGYPLTATMGDEVKLTTGVVSSKTGFQGDVSLYQISAPIQPGNSGGPLFDGHGNVIGIVSAKHRGAENVGYAIKASYLRNLMESAVSTNILPQNNKISGMNLSGKVKAVKNYVYYITCSSSGNVNAISSSSSYSGNSTYSSSTGQTFSYPSVNRNLANSMKVVSVSLQDNQTVLTLSDNNRKKDGSYYGWVTLDKNAYIVANGQRYTLKRAEGIALSPDKTYFSYAGETKTFTLYFPPIPKTTTFIDFIESADSEWKLYGIQLR